jgi:hypothetical protein
MDLDGEIREYQWRRKFERGPRRTFRVAILAATLAAILLVIARSVT